MATATPASTKTPKLKNWYLNAYVDNVWTDLVKDDSEVNGIIISNSSAGALDASVQIVNKATNTSLSIILPGTSIDPGDAKFVDFGRLAASNNERIQVKASGPGINFTASGIA